MPRVLLPVSTYNVPGRSAARLVNFFAEAQPSEGKAPILGRNAPGVGPYYGVGFGPGRGLHVMGGVLYAVSGGGLYRVASSGAATLLGTIPGSDRVYMADNGLQLVVVTGGTGHVYNGATVSRITDPDFRGAGPCAFNANFLVFVERGSGRFFSSDLASATDYDALDFATAEGAPDNLVALASDHLDVVLFGTETTELWALTGGAGFPYERRPNGFLELGCAAEAGVAKQDNSLYWIANDLTARRLEGATPVRVSQHNVEEAWRSYSTVADCQVFPYSLNGHLCVVFRFPTAGRCWVYDVTTQGWHERESYAGAGWRVLDAAEAYGRVWVQDAATGAVGILDGTARTEFGERIVCEWAYGNVYESHRRAFHSSLEVVMNTGVGTLAVPDPQIVLEYSNDGGAVWNSAGQRSLGATGRRDVRVQWHRLGMARDRAYRCRVSDAVPVVVTDTQLSVEVGAA